MPKSVTPSVDRAAVFERVMRVMRLRRPEIPPWLVATDLTFGQLRLLFRLRREGPTSMSRLAELLGMDNATVTGVVDRVERKGLVGRRHAEADRRVIEVQIADPGLELLDQIDGMRSDATRQLVDLLDDEELADFDRILGKILERSGAPQT